LKRLNAISSSIWNDPQKKAAGLFPHTDTKNFAAKIITENNKKVSYSFKINLKKRKQMTCA